MSAHAARRRVRPGRLGAVCAGALWASAHLGAYGLLAQIVAHDLARQHERELAATDPDVPSATGSGRS
ncbi:hypothetical protein [Streptomyces chrestomyceticus]|uniref:hypothetical protein n=1 Tax=Streptomyces chrestomyceticus TaxID=68185 RepID=UPI0033F0A1FF